MCWSALEGAKGGCQNRLSARDKQCKAFHCLEAAYFAGVHLPCGSGMLLEDVLQIDSMFKSAQLTPKGVDGQDMRDKAQMNAMQHCIKACWQKGKT